MLSENLRTKLAMLPDSPGCYLMKHQGEIIYVGKAVNLKNRVRSYFHTKEHTPKVAAMVAQVDDFDILLCNTNLEALALECNLIKLHKPHYNILLKDDKHYPYVRIDRREPFPRVTIARRMQKDGAQYFGPYIGATAVRDALEVVRRVFPIRTCDKKLPLKAPARPCVNYEIGRCKAPCAHLCSQEEYAQIIDGVVSFLNGNSKEICDRLNQEMWAAAKKMDYELAAQKRDALRDVEGLMERQRAIQTNDAQQDVLALAQDGLDAMAQVLIIRGGRMIGGDSFALPGEGNEPPQSVLTEFALRYYADRLPAREILTMPVEEPEVIAQLLRERRGGAVDVLTPQRGEKRALVLLAERNAADALEKRNAQRMIRQERTVGACQALAEAIGMQGYPKRIEGFDISNTQGVLSVASMVVFIDGEPAYREYRHYRIKTVEGANDFASMNEVLGRRFATHAAGGSCRALGDARSGADRRRPGAAALCARSHAVHGHQRAHVWPGQAAGGNLPAQPGGAGGAGSSYPRAAPDSAHPRRGAPLCHHLSPFAARQGQRAFLAGGYSGRRPCAPSRAAGAFRLH